MTLNDVMRKYFSWCPRFTSTNIQTQPFGSLLGGKAAVILLLAAWGLVSLVTGYSGIPYFLQLTRATIGFDPWIVLYGIQYVFPALEGVVLLILLLDYILAPTINRRHRIELATLIGLQIISWFAFVALQPTPITTPIRGGLPTGINVWSLTEFAILYLGVATESILGLYLIKRLLTGKAVLTKWTFLLVFTAFVTEFAQILFVGLINLESSNASLQLTTLASYIVFAAAAYFSIRTFSTLRGGDGFDLVLPMYLKISIIFYALVYAADEAWNSFLSSNLAFSFNPSKVALLVIQASFYVGLVGMCLFPPRISIGEKGEQAA